MTGSIALVIGPMFAGKTTELMRRVKREVFAKKRCCIVKYSHDNRYDADNVATHDDQVLTATFSISKLAELEKKWKDYDVVAIDEGQFFPDLLPFCCNAADVGKHVIVCALDGDFLRKPFGSVCDLIPHCEEVMKITAICMNCHEKDACFTMRTVSSTEQELIGGANAYAAVCRDCYSNREPVTPRRVQRYQDMVRDVKALVTGETLDAAMVEMEAPATKKARSESPPDNKAAMKKNNEIIKA